MKEYEFELRFKLPVNFTHDDALHCLKDLCDDATIGIGKEGEIGMLFIREGESLDNAVESAIKDTLQAIPETQQIM